MNSSGKRWVIGICVGMCISALIYIGVSRQRYYNAQARLAHALGEDTDSFIKANDLHQKAGTEHTLSTGEMEDAARLLKYPNRDIRLRVVYTLQACTNPAVKQTAIGLLRTVVEDKEPGIRSSVLRALLRQKDPDILADAQKQSQDADPDVREQANAVLKGKNVLN